MTQAQFYTAQLVNSVQWGTVPDWFAAIGTVGAFAATLAIIQSERLRRRRAQADSFVTYTSISWSPRYPIKDLSVRKMKRIEKDEGSLYHWVLNVFVYNTSDQPIVSTLLRSDPRSGPQFHAHQTLSVSKNGGLAIPPGSSFSRKIAFEDSPMGKKFYLQSVDAAGKQWVREIVSGRYVSRREVRIIRNLWRKQAERMQIDAPKYPQP